MRRPALPRVAPRFARVAPGIALVVALLATDACGGGETRVGAARVPEADAVEPVPAGAPLVILPPPPSRGPQEPLSPKGPPVEVPATLSGPVRLAVDRDVPYLWVVDAVDQITKAGGQPVFLVARRDHLGVLPAPSTPREQSISLVAYSDGRACVAPPKSGELVVSFTGAEERTCVIRSGGKHVDRAFTRELVRKARKEYELASVRVVLSPTLTWADAVRAIDAARTCCKEPMEVSVEMLQ